jgi:DNA processing protein
MTLDSLADEMNLHEPKDGVSSGAPEVQELSRGEPGYPERLELLSDPPERLFLRGRIPDGPMVAIVGSRDADAQARRLAAGLAADLVARGVTILSGGALGIDTAAHQGALDGSGPTVAVIGSGFDHVYPEKNRQLFERIAIDGAVLTELEPRTPPSRWTFPRRNRIVAALAGAVVVAQAGERSGALITARLARELDVPLGAVPGAAGDPKSRGCNQLIRTGAAMVEELADVLGLLDAKAIGGQLNLPGVGSRGKGTPRGALDGLSDEELAVLDSVGGTPVHIDEIVTGAGLTAPEVMSAILNLELAGLIEDRGGRSFIRVG